jgi:peptidoglycan-associated lipoprotein
MFGRKFMMVAIPVVLMAVGCASKKKQDDAGAGAAGSDAAIQNQDINYDAQGSDSGKIAGLQTVNFEFDKSALTASARQILEGNAKWIKSQPVTTGVTVEGHCDAKGSIEYNLALGERRAKAVKSYLVSLGVNAKRLETISYGKERLLDHGDGEDAAAKNRRANFVPVQHIQNINAQK